MLFVNFVLFFLGISTIILGALSVEFADQYFKTAEGQPIITVDFATAAIALGGVFVLLSFVGIIGAAIYEPPILSKDTCHFCSWRKVLLHGYASIMIVLIVVQVLMGIIGYMYVSELESVRIDNNATTESGAQTEFTTRVQKEIDAYLDSTYARCCVSEDGSMETTCTIIRDSVGANTGGWSKKSGFNVCGCDAQGFRSKVIDWFQSNVIGLAIGMVVMGVVEIVMVISACHLACHSHFGPGDGGSFGSGGGGPIKASDPPGGYDVTVGQAPEEVPADDGMVSLGYSVFDKKVHGGGGGKDNH